MGVRLRLAAIPEANRDSARTAFQARFECDPKDPKLYVMHFARFDPLEDMYAWMKLASEGALASRD